MRRRNRPLLFLFIACGVLGLGALAELSRERAIARDPLTAIDPRSIRSIAVTCSGCTTRRFEKVGAHWFMQEPKAAPANDAAVARLAAIVAAPVRFRRPAAGMDATLIGLDPPVATLEVNGTVLKFGSTDAIHNDRYVEVGDTIALVPDRFSARLFEPPESELAEQGSSSPNP